MKVLLLAPDFSKSKAWVTAHFCEEIGRQAEVVQRVFSPLDPFAEPIYGIDALIEDYQPDVLIAVRLQFNAPYQLGEITDIPKICILEDYFPRHYNIKNEWLTQHDFDLVFFSQRYFLPTAREFRKAGAIPQHTQFAWLPFSVDTDIYTGDPTGTREIDVAFICSLHQTEEGYPNRRAVADELRKLQAERPDLNILIRLLENKGGFLDPGGGIYREEYAHTLANSKIVVASLDATGSCNYRHFEAMASGAMLLTDGPPKDWRALNIEMWDAAIYQSCEQELGTYLRALLSPQFDAFRKDMARNGQATVKRLHSNKTRVQQMFRKIQEVCGV